MKTKSEQISDLMEEIRRITGWIVAIPTDPDGIDGFVMGTKEYVQRILGKSFEGKNTPRYN